MLRAKNQLFQKTEQRNNYNVSKPVLSVECTVDSTKGRWPLQVRINYILIIRTPANHKGLNDQDEFLILSYF